MVQKRKNPNNNETHIKNREKKYVGVRQRPSGRWVAEIKDTIQKIRVWLGTYDTAEAAARAYDEAACILRGPHTRTNFWPPSDRPSALPAKISDQLLLMLKSKSATKAASSGFRGFEIESSPNQLPNFNNTAAPLSAPCTIIDFSGYSPDADSTKLECLEQNLYVPTMNSTRSPGYSGGDCAECEEIDVADFMFGDGMEGLFGGDYWAFEIAEEIGTEEGEAEEEPVMKRLKYERRMSASLYALNGVSECLKLKGEFGNNMLEELKRSCDRKMKVMLEDEEKQHIVQQLDDFSSSSSSSSSPSSRSYSSSSFFCGDEDLMSLWASLDLPPIDGEY